MSETKYVTPADFYGQPDSVYIRIQNNIEKEGYNFSVLNQVLASGGELTENVAIMATMAWGLMTIAVSQPADVYQLGLRSQTNNMMQEALSEMPDEHQEAFKKPAGNA